MVSEISITLPRGWTIKTIEPQHVVRDHNKLLLDIRSITIDVRVSVWFTVIYFVLIKY